MEDIITKIRGDNTLPAQIAYSIEPYDFSANYSLLREDMTSLVKRQTEFKRLMHGQSSALYSAYLGARSLFLGKVMKKKQYALEEIFGIQLRNIGSMNSNLHFIIQRSKEELKQLEDYFGQVNNEVSSMLSAKDRNKAEEAEEKSRLYRTLRGQLSGAQKNEDYFKAVVSAKKLKREISEYAHKYSLANEMVASLSQESMLLDRTEDLLRTSVYTCERILLKAVLFERHLKNTKRTYELLKLQQKAMRSLDNAVETMGGFTLEMHALLEEGFERMDSIISSPGDYYSNASQNIEGMLLALNSSNSNRDRGIERILGSL